VCVCVCVRTCRCVFIGHFSLWSQELGSICPENYDSIFPIFPLSQSPILNQSSLIIKACCTNKYLFIALRHPAVITVSTAHWRKHCWCFHGWGWALWRCWPCRERSSKTFPEMYLSILQAQLKTGISLQVQYQYSLCLICVFFRVLSFEELGRMTFP
jgi:hypothetical protein